MCVVCGRSFDERRVCVHQEICKKAVKSKRKSFDSLKQRIKGTTQEKHADNIRMRIKTPIRMQHGNWRQAHEQFLNTIRTAKQNMKKEPELEKALDPCAVSGPTYTRPKAEKA